MKAFLQMKLPIKVEKGGSMNERLHLFAKDEKEYTFLSIGSCGDKTEKGTSFLSILPSLEKSGKGVKEQPLQTQLPVTLIMAIFSI